METIRIEGEITADSARDLRRRLDAARGDDVMIEIDSHGGSFIAGLKMYADLQDYKGKTTARIIRALSAATLPLCGCSRAVNTAAGIVMVHGPTTAAVKDVGLSIGDLQDAIGSLKRTTGVLAAIYAEKNAMGWPMNRAIGIYQTLMRREGGTTWGPGGTPPLCDSCESNGHRPISNLATRAPVPVGALGEVAKGAFEAGVAVGVREAVATIAKNGRPRWFHSDGSAFGQPFANQLRDN